MKIALIGAGKTGGEVSKLHQNTLVFNSSHLPTLEKLKDCDIILCFVPGDIFLSYIDLFIDSKLPVVCGATGFEWPSDIQTRLKEQGCRWIRAHNFSLGMNIVKKMIETLARAKDLYPEANFSIHDIHHTKKLDSPSGTALSWKDWLGLDADITAQRTGDVVGYHHVEMQSKQEKIKITHEALDRSLFARGAIWAAEKLYKDDKIKAGLHHFSDIVYQELNI